MIAVKDEVRTLLERLPDDCSFEDIQYHLYVLEKVRRSAARVEQDGALEHDEVEKRLHRWLSV
ncbi:MAG TPA: hypothetical protein PK849_08765 [Synergistales bacterium]|jgi:hypothetical protein|nr:hypothetical protein [Synergistaceae bacterium]HOO87189.1 hypothetical protein [Synergistales bacterium]HPE66256.1 hypothetical protein [Synergistales bacterium]HRV98038.1 hypothetical protein [Aminobacteriaceae bacterium]